MLWAMYFFTDKEMDSGIGSMGNMFLFLLSHLDSSIYCGKLEEKDAIKQEKLALRQRNKVFNC